MKSVIVYSTPTCPYCVMAKKYLVSKGVTFEDVDLTKNESRIQEMVDKSGQMGVPVVDIGGNIVVGFQPGVFDKLLMK